MDKEKLIAALSTYTTDFKEEEELIPIFLNFVKNNVKAYQRSNPEGHMTASSWIIDPLKEKVLLLHHRKLQKWLQPGGHADGMLDLLAVAKKELAEETGLKNIDVVGDQFFDLDIHIIPANEKEPEHRHYDVRYLFIADSSELPQRNSESNAVAWIRWEEVSDKCGNESSIIRMLNKTKVNYK